LGPKYAHSSSAFDPMDEQSDHHAVVQPGTAATDGERQPGDHLAVGFGEATHVTLTDDLTKAMRDMFDLAAPLG
jgi:hypothetical protein